MARIMRWIGLAWVLGLAVGIGLPAGKASAQRGVNIETLRPTFDRFGFIGIQGSATPGHKRWNLGLWTNYTWKPLRAELQSGSTEVIIDDRVEANLFFQIGVFGRVAFALEAPFVLYQTGDADLSMDGEGSLTGAAVEDPRLTTKIRMLGKKTDPNQDQADGPGLALLFRLPIPVGNEDMFASENQFTFDLETLVDFHILGTGGGVMLGWRFRGEGRQIATEDLRQQMLYGLAFKIGVPSLRRLYGLAEIRGSTAFRGSGTNTLEGEIGPRIDLGDVSLWAALGTGFIRGIGAPTLRAMLGFSWSPKSDDLDGDGIPDSRDDCPRLPEDIDGFEDEDGCLDPDNDNDFIPDVDDRCPNVEALEGQDLDEDGCTDLQ